MIVLRTPKGWTGPKAVDGLPAEGTFRSHQVPLAQVREDPAHLAQLEEWLRSYRRRSCSTSAGACAPSWPRCRRGATRRMSANPHANGGLLLRALELPDFRDYAVTVDAPGDRHDRGDAGARRVAARRDRANPDTLPAHGTRRDGVQPASARVRGDRPGLGGRDARHATTISRPTAA